MKVILLFFGIMLVLLGGAGIGYMAAKAELRGRARRELERNGWSREHQKIYHAAVGVLNKIVNAHNLDVPMEFRMVQLPDALNKDAQTIIDRYRKEIDA